jgi:hypothetical protein
MDTFVDDFDANELYSASDIFNIQQMKCKYMSPALRIVLEERHTWKRLECCNEAAKDLNQVDGHNYITSGNTMMIWH